MTSTIANVEMAAIWDGDEGVDWARDWERYDRAITGYHRKLLAGAAIQPDDRILDVGCGNGESTRDAARRAPGGGALGVDLSSQMIERARELARADGVDNAEFLQADAQVHPFEEGRFDVVISRFGTMFFADQAAAFRNIHRATRAGGRLAMVGWRGLADNEWLQCIFGALAAGRDLPGPQPGTPGPFGLADAARVRSTLADAGFEAVNVEAVDETFLAGADAEDAFRFIGSGGAARGLLQDLDADGRARALDALRATMAEHDTGHGVLFGSGVWLITARRSAG